MKLYTYWRSSAAYRIRIALNVKGLDWEAVPVDLVADGGQHRQPAYLDKNPQGLVPALEDDGQVFSQSLAIMEYLEEKYPGPALLPSGAAGRARVRAMAQMVACEMHPLNNLSVLQFLKHELGQGDEGRQRWYEHWIARGFAALEKQVQESGQYCYGGTVSMADACLVPQMYNARRFDCDLSPYPNLVAIDAHLTGLEAFIVAAPENQTDAPA